MPQADKALPKTRARGKSTTVAKICLLSADQRATMFRRLAAAHPNARSELNFRNPFELLCAVVLSAQATDVSVNKVTPALFAAAPDAMTMAALGEQQIAAYIKSIGLWRAKAGYLAKLSQALVHEYGGAVPDDYAALIKLPGVGSKTAKVVLNCAFNQPTVAVDTHIFRVANRTGLCLGATPKAVEDKIVQFIPKEHLLPAHHYLLLHGRYVCKAQKPNCMCCCLKDLCSKRLEKNKNSA